MSKTGTSSLSAALTILGYRTVHYPPLDRLRELLDDCDAATDTPVACSFRELDRQYPGSRFILTVRDPDSWLSSARREFEGRAVRESWKREVRLRTYGVLEWDAVAFLGAYHRHVRNVCSYFSSRPGYLLVLDIVAGEGWKPLCEFLGRPIPRRPFPHENATPPIIGGTASG